jgi:hypothetical protein
MAETLTRYVLELIGEEWPEPQLPEDFAAYDTDDAVLLTTGERRTDISQEEYTLVSVSRDAIDPTPKGTGPTYETIETLDIEIEAVVSEQYGTVDSHAEFRRIVDNVKRALDTELEFPDVSLTNRTRQPARLSLFIGSETDRSSNHRDHFRVGFPVRIRGKLEP